MRHSSFCSFVVCLLLLVGCSTPLSNARRPSTHKDELLARGSGVTPAQLHIWFQEAYSLRNLPKEQINGDQQQLGIALEATLYCMGDRDFAAALSREPSAVRRSLVPWFYMKGLLPDYPRTYGLLAPYAR